MTARAALRLSLACNALLAAGLAFALFAPRAGRFAFVALDQSGVYRLDTATGQIEAFGLASGALVGATIAPPIDTKKQTANP